MKFDTVIVGGGLTGICCALALSTKYPSKKIAIVDENPHLGGRLFSFEPAKSGPGWEIWNEKSKSVLANWIPKKLSDNEQKKWDEECAKHPNVPPSKPYFVKKEIVSWEDFFSGSNEMCTKKECETLMSLFQNPEKKPGEKFKQSDKFRVLNPSTQNLCLQILETLFGEDISVLPYTFVQKKWKELWEAPLASGIRCTENSFQLENFLEEILSERGVIFLSKSRVNRIQKMEDDFAIQTSQLQEALQREILSNQVVMTIPFLHSLTLYPKEWKSPDMARYTTQCPPRSVVYYEVQPENHQEEGFWQEHFQNFLNNLKTCQHLYFPQERCRALCTVQKSVIFYKSLSYENSYTSANVKQTLSTLKKAFARVSKHIEMKEKKEKFPFSSHLNFHEKVILDSLGYEGYHNQAFKYELSNITGKMPNFYFCGENFFSMGEEPIERIVACADLL